MTEDTLIITDVAPRDGLQNQRMPVPTDAKLELIRLLHAAGVASIEATSFVSPKAVPQMADAAALMTQVHHLLPGLRASALVPNQKGLERAHAAGVREVAVVLSATDTMNLKNINMDLARATAICEETLRAAGQLGLRTRAYVAVAFDCPFEGATPLDRVVELAVRMEQAGADEIVIADTIGSASPGMAQAHFTALAQALPVHKLAAHFHDTRGMATANAWAAIQAGVRRFDASAGGIGGCPFAPGAAGNAATEDLVLMAERSGLATNISLPGLLQAVAYAELRLGKELGGRSSAWLRRQYAGRVDAAAAT